MKAVFDTNILIDYCNGSSAAQKELEQYSTCIISVITWMELLIGANNTKEEGALRSFLSGFLVIDIDLKVRELAVEIKKKMRMRLPDAIILATARSLECILVTRNTKDFSPDFVDIRVPYSY